MEPLKLRFEPVTSANRAQALALTVHPAQAGFVESVAECLAQADKEHGWRPVLIYVENAHGHAHGADERGAVADGVESRAAGGGANGASDGKDSLAESAGAVADDVESRAAGGGANGASDGKDSLAESAGAVADGVESRAAGGAANDAAKGTRHVAGYTEQTGESCVDETSSSVNAAAPVGFAMYKYFGLFAPFGRAWLDRLLIDARYQGHGYGAAAVTALCARIRAEYSCRKVYLSVYEDNAPAIRLYEKAGFAFNGQRDVKGEKVMVAR